MNMSNLPMNSQRSKMRQENCEQRDGFIAGTGVLDSECMDSTQQRVFDAFCDGKSVTLLGSAGSGKSFLIKKMLAWARNKYPEDSVISCAYTNSASEAIGGMTIHTMFNALPSWRFTDEKLLQRVLQKKDTTERILRMRVLFIDEISQLIGSELDAIEYVLRILTKSERHAAFPFARRQLVLSGDHLQLEAVKLIENGIPKMASYEGRSWRRLFGGDGTGMLAFLDANHRQRGDNVFFEILKRIRLGTQTERDMMRLNETSNRNCQPSSSHVRLCLRKAAVEEITMRRMASLKSQLHVSHHYDIYPECGLPQVLVRALKRRLDDAAPRKVLLKQGASVMLTRKVGDCIPGTLCVVTEIWMRTRGVNQGNRNEVLLKAVTVGRPGKDSTSIDLRVLPFEIYRDDGTVVATRRQIPVIPAYALTIHRSQGLSFDRVAIDFSEIMLHKWVPPGAAYVALSRCRSLDGLWVKGLCRRCIIVSPRAQRFQSYVERIGRVHPNRIIGSVTAGIGKENHDPNYLQLPSTEERMGNAKKRIRQIPCTTPSVRSSSPMKRRRT